MKLRPFASLASILVPAMLLACGSNSSSNPGAQSGDDSGVGATGGDGGPGGGADSGPGATGPTGGTDGGSGGHQDSGTTKNDGGNPGGDSGSGGTTFAAGTICNKTGHALTPPATLKHVIVFLFENQDLAAVNGNASAPYFNSIATQCGTASSYLDNCFASNLVSLPHYLALASGSNCNTGLDSSDPSCITDDNDATSHTLSTSSIFQQVTSWKSYQEGMPSACDTSSAGGYACKHNPPAYFTQLSTCSANDIPVADVTCSNTPMTACSTPSNAFTDDIKNDTLPAFAFFTPNLTNDMHDGTVTQGDNFLYTYLPLILQSKAYLNGEVAVHILWDEQSSFFSGGATPNAFVSPYITAGTVASKTINHFSVLRSWENALGISTYLGCASGTAPGGGACPAGSTEDVRAALNF